MPFIASAEMLVGRPLRGWTGHFFHSQHMTCGIWHIDADAEALHEHHHPQEEVWTVVEGRIALTVDGVERTLGPGDAAVVPPNTRHCARPLGRCHAVVVDWPVREHLPGVEQAGR